jgi:multicomponent K+:H+ antiporter subunit E
VSGADLPTASTATAPEATASKAAAPGAPDAANKPIPHWGMSVFLAVAWLMLQRSLEPFHLVFAVLLGVGLPWLTRQFWPDATPVSAPGQVLLLFVRMSFDIVIANIEVARLILGSPTALQPRFFDVPTELGNDLALSILASCISLTPGTVTVEIPADKKSLRIHGMHVPDEEATIRQIKQRYEAPLLRIFPC